MANRGPLYGLSKDCKLKAEKKFDITRAHDVMEWMEAVLERKLHSDVRSLKSELDFSDPLRDGVALCELMNIINPGAIKKINNNKSAFKQMENIEMFTKACKEYGMNPLDIFQMTDLYETKAMYTVFNCLHSLGSVALKNGFAGPNYGVKISDSHERHFSKEQIAKGNQIIPMQAGTNRAPSQSGMTPYGLSRQIVPTDGDVTEASPASQAFISLQYGTNKTATQSGMTPYGLGRQIVSMSSVSDDTIGSDAMSTTNSDGATDKDLYVDENNIVEESVTKNTDLYADGNNLVQENLASDNGLFIDDNAFAEEGVL